MSLPRTTDTFLLFVDGKLKQTSLVNTYLIAENFDGMHIGRSVYANLAGTYNFIGDMYDFRLTAGRARYTADFSASLTAITTIDPFYRGTNIFLPLKDDIVNSAYFAQAHPVQSFSGVVTNSSFATFLGASTSGIKTSMPAYLPKTYLNKPDFTIEAWIRPHISSAGTYIIFETKNATGSKGIRISHSGYNGVDNGYIIAEIGDAFGGYNNTLVGLSDKAIWAEASQAIALPSSVKRYSSIGPSDPYYGNVGLLLRADGPTDGGSPYGQKPIIDKSLSAKVPDLIESTISGSGTIIVTTIGGVGGASINLDHRYPNRPQNFRYAGSSDFNLGGTPNWTIEFFTGLAFGDATTSGRTLINHTNVTSFGDIQNPVDFTYTRDYLAANTGWAIGTRKDGQVFFAANVGGSFDWNALTTAGYVPNLTAQPEWDNRNIMYHFAIVRDSFNYLRMYVEGVQVSSKYISSDFPDSSDISLRIGDGPSHPTLSDGVNILNETPITRVTCGITQLRITKGICRYPNGTTFDIPQIAFPAE
jgi:hypothetical protein